MANNIWSNYTEKTATPVDADEVMVLDSTDRKNKRLLFGTFWKWVAKKLNEATISELETDNKTIIGAINALNGKTSWLLYGGIMIPPNSDLNAYTTPGTYYNQFSTDIKTIKNLPITIEFKLIVEYQFGTIGTYIMQTFIDYITMIKYCRRSYDSGTTWQSWYKMNTPQNIK